MTTACEIRQYGDHYVIMQIDYAYSHMMRLHISSHARVSNKLKKKKNGKLKKRKILKTDANKYYNDNNNFTVHTYQHIYIPSTYQGEHKVQSERSFV